MPLSRKNSPMAQAEYGAKYCKGAASEAVADTTILLKKLKWQYLILQIILILNILATQGIEIFVMIKTLTCIS